MVMGGHSAESRVINSRLCQPKTYGWRACWACHVFISLHSQDGNYRILQPIMAASNAFCGSRDTFRPVLFLAARARTLLSKPSSRVESDDSTYQGSHPCRTHSVSVCGLLCRPCLIYLAISIMWDGRHRIHPLTTSHWSLSNCVFHAWQKKEEVFCVPPEIMT